MEKNMTEYDRDRKELLDLLQSAKVQKFNQKHEVYRTKYGQALITRKLRLSKLNLTGICLADCSLLLADLHSTVLDHADLRNTRLVGANLKSAYLNNSDLRGANLWKADMSFAHVQDSNLRDADLLLAKLTAVRFHRSNLDNAILHGCNLIHANLEGSSMMGTSIGHANFQESTGRPKTDDRTWQFIYSQREAYRTYSAQKKH